MVGVAGFEPTTFRSQSGRATKLRHTPSVRHVGYMPGDPLMRPVFRGPHARAAPTPDKATGKGCALTLCDPLGCCPCHGPRTYGAHGAGVAQW